MPTIDVIRANLEPSYTAFPLVWGWRASRLDPLWFEASLAPHFLLGGAAWPVALEFTPKIVMRMFRERSSPVKTPSYMPRLTAYLLFSKGLTGRPVFYGSLTAAHHSNGQSGSPSLPGGEVNHETGDFSTHFLEVAAYAADGAESAWWVSPSLEWHPRFGEGDGLDGRYGFWRAHLAFAGFRGLLWDDKLTLKVSALLDRVEVRGDSKAAGVLRRFPLSVRYAVRLPAFGVGAYLGVYSGPDYYNIWFDRYVSVLQIGLVGDTSPRLSGVF